MTDVRRAILERVAKGEITPAEAEAALRDLESSSIVDPTPGRWTPPPASEVPAVDPTRSEPATSRPSGSARQVKVRADFGELVIEGDPSVAEVEVDGDHTATREGDTLVIRGQRWTDLDVDVRRGGPGVFAINVGRRKIRTRTLTRSIHGFDEIFKRGASALHVRVNPALAVDATIDAGPMSITGVTGPIRARAAAGPITIEGFETTLDVSVNAGAIRASGRLTSGESKVSSDAGAVRLELDPTSNVHITAEAALGRVALEGSEPDRRKFGSRCETVLGTGDATLRVETAMGSINVSCS